MWRARCGGPVRRSGTAVRCGGPVRRSSAMVQCDGPVRWSSAMVQCDGPVRWSSAMVQCGPMRKRVRASRVPARRLGVVGARLALFSRERLAGFLSEVRCGRPKCVVDRCPLRRQCSLGNFFSKGRRGPVVDRREIRLIWCELRAASEGLCVSWCFFGAHCADHDRLGRFPETQSPHRMGRERRMVY